MSYSNSIVEGLKDRFTAPEIDKRGYEAIGPLLGAFVGGIVSLEANQLGIYNSLYDYLGITDLQTQYLVGGGCSTALFIVGMVAGYLARDKIGELLDLNQQQPLVK